MTEDVLVTSDMTIHGLRQAVAELDAEIGRLHESRAMMLGSILYLESRRIQPLRAESVEPATASDSDPPPPKPITVAEERGDAIEAVLREAGQPMKKKPILDAVVEGGLHIGRKNQLSAISQCLTNDDRFQNTDPGQGEWGLWEWDSDGEKAHPPLTLV